MNKQVSKESRVRNLIRPTGVVKCSFLLDRSYYIFLFPGLMKKGYQQLKYIYIYVYEFSTIPTIPPQQRLWL